MSVRVQVVLDEAERELFRSCARKEGMSLSSWLRKLATERAKAVRSPSLETAEDLMRFWEDCDRREKGREPEWEQHLEVMQESRLSGLPRS